MEGASCDPYGVSAGLNVLPEMGNETFLWECKLSGDLNSGP
jgi:hypothetical protein